MINLKIGETELLVGRPTFRMLFGSGCRTPPNEGLCRGGGGGLPKGYFVCFIQKNIYCAGLNFCSPTLKLLLTGYKII